MMKFSIRTSKDIFFCQEMERKVWSCVSNRLILRLLKAIFNSVPSACYCQSFKRWRNDFSLSILVNFDSKESA